MGNGDSCLHIAVECRSYKIIKCILRHKINAETVSYIRCRFCFCYNVWPLSQINEQNEEGDTALHLATELGNAEAVRLLVRYGADKNIQNGDNERAIDIACDNFKYDIIEILNDGEEDESKSYSLETRENSYVAFSEENIEAES